MAAVDFWQRDFAVAAASIAFNPIFWNIVARREYHNRSLTKIFSGNSVRACYALAVTIFSLGMIRDYLYTRALVSQPSHALLETLPAKVLAYSLLGIGNILVLSSMWSLGITGTYLGDYFGILMDEMVSGFPFNAISAPMYYGSTLSFLGTAILYGKPAGLLLTAEVFLAYKIALMFEDPFTASIYAKREREKMSERHSKKEL